MVPQSMFRNVTFVGANAYTFLLYAALGGCLYFVPIDLQNVQGYSPTAAGGALLPLIVIMFVAARWSGGLVATMGARIPLVAGAIVAGCGFFAYARTGIGGSYWTTFFPAAVILGMGGALFVAPLTTVVMESVEDDHAGIASGVNNAVARVAGLLALAVFGIILESNLYGDFDRRAAALNLSDQARRTVAAQRAALSTGRPLESLPEPESSRVNAALRAAYTRGFSRTMIARPDVRGSPRLSRSPPSAEEAGRRSGVGWAQPPSNQSANASIVACTAVLITPRLVRSERSRSARNAVQRGSSSPSPSP